MESPEITGPKETAEKGCGTEASIEPGHQFVPRSAWDDPPGFDAFSYVPPIEPVVNHYPNFAPLVPLDQKLPFTRRLHDQNFHSRPNTNTSFPNYYPGMYPPVAPPNEDQFWTAWTGNPVYTDSARSFYTLSSHTRAEAQRRPFGLGYYDHRQQMSPDGSWMASYPHTGDGPLPPIPSSAKANWMAGLVQEQEGHGLPPPAFRSRWTEGYPPEGYDGVEVP